MAYGPWLNTGRLWDGMKPSVLYLCKTCYSAYFGVVAQFCTYSSRKGRKARNHQLASFMWLLSMKMGCFVLIPVSSLGYW